MLAWLAAAAALWSTDLRAVPGTAAAADDDDRPVVSRPYLYTALEIGAVLVGGEIWYLRHGTSGSWERGVSLQTWKSKALGEDVGFDTDRYNTNAIGHPIDGTAFYQIARGNGFGPGASLVVSVLGSTFWEYFGEIPERTSLNDLILTPLGGAVIGEATYRLGRYLAVSGTGVARCTGAFVFAPIAALNDRPICRARGGIIPTARLALAVGFNRAVFDDSAARDEFALAFGSDIVSERTYQRPGAGAVLVHPGEWSAFNTDLRLGDNHLSGFWLNARTVWAGRYDRHYHSVGDESDGPRPSGPPEGWGWLLAVGSSFDYRLRDLPSVHDRIASAGIAGPSFELSARRGVAVRATFNLQYAFAMVGSIAYRTAYQTVVGEAIQPSLRDMGYYYAQGVVSAATIGVDLGPIGIGVDGRGGWYWSIDSGDQAQSSARSDVLLHDTRFYATASLWSRPLAGAFRFGLAYQHVWRTSTMAGTSFSETETDITGTAGIAF